MNNLWRAAAIMLLALPGAAAFAAGTPGLVASTTGLGVEYSWPWQTRFHWRVGIANLGYRYGTTLSGSRFEAALNITTVPLLLEMSLTGPRLRAVTGIFLNGSRVDIAGRPENDSYIINGVEYAADQLLQLKGQIKFPLVAPYLGIRWQALRWQHRYALRVDLGILYTGIPNMTQMEASGPLTSDERFQADFAAQKAQLKKDLRDYRRYPVVGLSLAF